MFIKVPQGDGARYVDFNYITSIQRVDDSVIFFLKDDEVMNVTFKSADLAEDAIDGIFYYNGKLYEIEEEDVDGEDN